MFIKLYTKYQRFLLILFILPFLIAIAEPRLIPLTLGIGILSFTAVSYVFKDRLMKKGIKVKGKKIGESDDTEESPDSKTIIVRYTTLDGQLIVSVPAISRGLFPSSGARKMIETDEEVSVIYHREYPKAFMLEEHEFGIISVQFILLLGGVFSLVAGIIML